MARPTGTRKPPEEKYITRAMKWPPALWAELEGRIPERERSAFVRQAVRDALLRQKAQQLLEYYTTDPDTLAWADCTGEGAGEPG